MINQNNIQKLKKSLDNHTISTSELSSEEIFEVSKLYRDEIEQIRKNLKEVNIVANHVFFDLNKNFIEDINIKDKTGSMALSQILNGTSYKHSFTATSDIDTVASSRMVRKNVVTALIGDIDNSE